MIKLILEKEEYSLPSDFSEINISTYQKLTNEIVSKRPEKKDGTEDKRYNPVISKDIQRFINILNILTGIPESDIKRIDVSQLKDIQGQLEYLFIKSNAPLHELIEIDGITYGLNKDLGHISFGEYIDLESFSNGTKHMNDLHILMAILYRPVIGYDRHKFFNWLFKGLKHRSPDYIIEKYIDDDVLDRASLFKEKMTMDIVFGSMFFFILLEAAYTLSLKGFTPQEITEMMMTMIMVHQTS